MRKVGEVKSKKEYYIMLNGRVVGKTWAVSAEKARANYWWKNVKYGSEMTPRDYDPEDFDVVEA